jgi:hypothetical protein
MWNVLQLGAAREGNAGHQEGWAWIETPEGYDQGVIEAYRLADLVQNTLRIEVCPHSLPSMALDRFCFTPR